MSHIDCTREYQEAANRIELAFAPAIVTNYLDVPEGVRFYIKTPREVTQPQRAVDFINDKTKYRVLHYSLKPDLTVTLTGV